LRQDPVPATVEPSLEELTPPERDSFLLDIAPRFTLPAFLVLLAVGFTVAIPNLFPTVGNLTVMIDSQAILLFLALAVTLPLRTGDFDLSVGQMMTVSSVVLALLTVKMHVAPGEAVVIVLLGGVLVGSINGFLVVVVGLDAFVTTLGMSFVLEGVGYALSNFQVIFGVPEALTSLSRNVIFGLPQSAYFGWALLLLLWYLYDFTPFGRHLLVTGDSRDVAKLSGVRVGMVRFAAFLGASVICAFAGIMLAGQLGAADPSVGTYFLLTPYAAAFLGTTAIQMGRFNAFGTLIGLYLLVVAITGLELMGAPTWLADVFNGGALIIAILFARMTRARR
jgi:ribose transport system permease protein